MSLQIFHGFVDSLERLTDLAASVMLEPPTEPTYIRIRGGDVPPENPDVLLVVAPHAWRKRLTFKIVMGSAAEIEAEFKALCPSSTQQSPNS